MKRRGFEEYKRVVLRRAMPIATGFTIALFLAGMFLRFLFPSRFHLNLGAGLTPILLLLAFLIIVSIPIILIATLVYWSETKDLRASEARYRQLFESHPNAMWVYDVKTLRFLAVNEAAIVKYGYSLAEFQNMTLRDIRPPDDVPLLIEDIKRISPGFAHSMNWRHLKKDKTLIDVEVISNDIHFEGRSARFVLIDDVTEKKKIQAQLLRAQRMESIGTLAGGIAHDLNNVLAPILMGMQFLLERLDDEQDQQMVKTMETAAIRGAAIVRQVLTFARGAEGQRVTIQPHRLLTNIEKMLQETFPKSIAIEIDIPENLWPVSGDPTQLDQVLLNLCINARDAMPDGGTLRIAAENHQVDERYARLNPDANPGRYLLTEVADSGEGIAPEAMDQIFDPFFTTKEIGKGTGLGLSTARAIVKSHGGFLNVYSELGKGTSFKIFLPATDSEHSAVLPVPVTALPSGSGELILVVDDEASIRDIATVILETFNYRVITATDGADAVAKYAQRPQDFQVVLLDLMMPVMDGQHTASVLEKMNSEVRIIATSGLTASGLKVVNSEPSRSIRLLLPKPYSAEKLLKAVHDVISAETSVIKK